MGPVRAPNATPWREDCGWKISLALRMLRIRGRVTQWIFFTIQHYANILFLDPSSRFSGNPIQNLVCERASDAATKSGGVRTGDRNSQERGLLCFLIRFITDFSTVPGASNRHSDGFISRNHRSPSRYIVQSILGWLYNRIFEEFQCTNVFTTQLYAGFVVSMMIGCFIRRVF